jgi:hypothetical protein
MKTAMWIGIGCLLIVLVLAVVVGVFTEPSEKSDS